MIEKRRATGHSFKDVGYHVLLPLTAGGWIYLAWRPKSLRLFVWLDFVGWSPWVSQIRERFSEAELVLPSWLVFSFPTGAWVYALSMYLWLVWHEVSPRVACSVMMIGPALGVGSELLQATGQVAGTYDVDDLITCLAAYLLALCQVGKLNGGSQC